MPEYYAGIRYQSQWDTSRHGQSAPISALNVPSFYDPSVDCEEYSPTQGVPEYLQAVENALKDAVLHAPRPRRNLSKKHLDQLAGDMAEAQGGALPAARVAVCDGDTYKS